MRSERAGLSLLEVLLVVLLISGGLVWILNANYLNIRTAREAHLRFFITKGVLECELEALRGLDFDDAALSIGTHTPFSTPIITPPTPPLGAFIAEVATAITDRRYLVAWDDAPTNRRKRITVQVTWTDPFGHTRTNTLTTLITDPTP